MKHYNHLLQVDLGVPCYAEHVLVDLSNVTLRCHYVPVRNPGVHMDALKDHPDNETAPRNATFQVFPRKTPFCFFTIFIHETLKNILFSTAYLSTYSELVSYIFTSCVSSKACFHCENLKVKKYERNPLAHIFQLH